MKHGLNRGKNRASYHRFSGSNPNFFRNVFAFRFNMIALYFAASVLHITGKYQSPFFRHFAGPVSISNSLSSV
jgi:hypothetical protein